MATILQNRQEILQRIAKVCTSINTNNTTTNKDNITLVAVSKTFNAQYIIEAIYAGQRHFAENYVQEGIQKIQELKLKNYNNLIWHYIGHIQSNKANLIAENFDWVHTVTSEKIAQKLNHKAEEINKKLQICIQVNIDNSPTKSGLTSKQQIFELANYISALENLNLRGLMAIPDANMNTNIQSFKSMQILFNELKAYMSNFLNTNIDTLSMGMSHDFEQAIKYGANMLRIGSAFFGVRG